MKVLLLGGTGVMGMYLVKLLDRDKIETYVTSRQDRESFGTIHYVKGNAMDDNFMRQIIGGGKNWDVILDFMSYKTDQFKKRLKLLLGGTKQYVYISTARVYGNQDYPIKESSPRLLDCSDDRVFLLTDEYSLTKARQEDLLLNSGYSNYTIVRPCITYGDNRLQLGVYEKEEWLYRVLHGRTVVFPQEIAKRVTTLTTGEDVARAIYTMVGNERAVGDIVHITCGHHRKWEDIIDIYAEAIHKLLGQEFNVKTVSLDEFLSVRYNSLKYQVIYDRVYDRVYDVSHLNSYIDVSSFTPPEVGIPEALQRFMANPLFKGINWRFEARKDRLAGEHTPLSEIPSLKHKLVYLQARLYSK